MIINERIGNIAQNLIINSVDYLDLNWYETSKRIQRKRTRSGKDVAIKFLKEKQRLYDGDILFIDDESTIVVNVLETKTIVLSPQSILEMSAICHEIGNKHLPLYSQNDLLLMPFEMTIFRWLESAGYHPEIQELKLLHLLNANVDHHRENKIGASLSTKDLKIKLSK
ncbi:urease accessory protein UreE [Empedobacter brevis]|uniref:urease accessory protein UreE n=1 Tax=Empedobacter brevis TaxID=247 RepID=UPI0039B10911